MRLTGKVPINVVSNQRGGAGDTNSELYAKAGQRLSGHYRRLIDFSKDAENQPALLEEARTIAKELRLAALDAERNELYQASVLGRQNEELIRRLVYELDLQESQMCAHHGDRATREVPARRASE